jgi:NAD(P)-dependent dehydrogenase (short-subunit alcohol dehydrogenase family)
MQQVAFITGADRGLGYALSAALLDLGWCVFAGQYLPEWTDLNKLKAVFPSQLHVVPLDVNLNESVKAAANVVSSLTDHIDILVNNAGVLSATEDRSVRVAQDYGEFHRLYDTNSLGPIRTVEAFIPLLDLGQTKRLCFVSSEAGSIERTKRRSWYSYCMSKTALNMAVKIMFNELRPQGYTFRLYHPGWMRTYMSGTKSLVADMEPEDAAAWAIPLFLADSNNEDRLSLIDYRGQEWPW